MGLMSFFKKKQPQIIVTRYNKTIAYDLYHLIGERRLAIIPLKFDPSRTGDPRVSLFREDLVRFTNNYKVLYEFVGEILQKPDFSLFDIVDYYNGARKK